MQSDSALSHHVDELGGSGVQTAPGEASMHARSQLLGHGGDHRGVEGLVLDGHGRGHGRTLAPDALQRVRSGRPIGRAPSPVAYARRVQSLEPFAPPGAAWTVVSPKLITVRLISGLIQLGIVALVGVALLVVAPWWIGGVILALAAAGALLAAWLVPRQVRAIGYDVGADALTITNGIMFRQLVVVPYARMQYVDVQAGPLLRRFGLANVQLHTASAATDARIPGLEAQVAADLRDELARLGETKSVGL